jgi:hypothetical protein
MIKVLSRMPAGVLGLEAIDDVEEEDYRNVVVPAVNAAIAEHGKVRLVYVLGPEFDEYEEDAAWGGPEARCPSPGVVRADRNCDRRALGRPDDQNLQRSVARTSARVSTR